MFQAKALSGWRQYRSLSKITNAAGHRSPQEPQCHSCAKKLHNLEKFLKGCLLGPSEESFNSKETATMNGCS